MSPTPQTFPLIVALVALVAALLATGPIIRLALDGLAVTL